MVKDFADYVMVMQQGAIVELETVSDLFLSPRETYTKALLNAALDPDPEIQAQKRASQL